MRDVRHEGYQTCSTCTPNQTQLIGATSATLFHDIVLAGPEPDPVSYRQLIGSPGADACYLLLAEAVDQLDGDRATARPRVIGVNINRDCGL